MITSEWQPDLPMEIDDDLHEWVDIEAAEYLLTDLNLPIEIAEDRLNASGHNVNLVDLGDTLGKYLVMDGATRMVDADGFPHLVSDFIWGLSDFSLISYMEDMGYEEKNEWDDVSVAYHATPSENVSSIERVGLEMRNESRGLSNRGTSSAVFMAEEIDELGSYGDALFEIDLSAMKTDGYMPRLERESPIFEGDMRIAVARHLGVSDPELYTGESDSEGIHGSTLVLFGDVPPKYVRRIN
jgi:hypothetical protein